ncbi:MAG: MFS transporter [Nitrospirota bacterium]|nr:MFS transporter [Nitrospirota bacterium]
MSVTATPRTGPRLFRPGDANAFFGLMLDNMTQLVLMAAILVGVFQFPSDLVLQRMIPGAAMGVLLGNLLFTRMAWRMDTAEGRGDRTAMPLGIDTPSLFAFTFGITGPAYLVLGDAHVAWKVSVAIIVLCGLAKLLGAMAGPFIHRHVPRAGLLGPIAGVALLLIGFLPSLHIFAEPLVGLVSLGIVLFTLVGRVRLPGGFPGAFAAVLAGTTLFYVLKGLGLTVGAAHGGGGGHALLFAPPLPTFGFLEGLAYVGPYLPIAIPFALTVLVSAVDVTESAAAAGDHYSSRAIITVDGLSTLAVGLFGGVVQTTPYIGHPAYKKMGAGVGFTLATALFIGFGGVFGYLAIFVDLLPVAAVAPILVFIGLEIASQGFRVTPRRHYDAVALAFIPIVADLVLIQMKQTLAGVGKGMADLSGQLLGTYQTVLVLANGFILTAMIWASLLTAIIDRRFREGAVFAALAAVFTVIGLIHSPFEDGRLFLPGQAGSNLPWAIAAGYALIAVALAVYPSQPPAPEQEGASHEAP